MIWGGEYLLNKGFTLVELLAVIVILAIILVIAVPSILDIINKTKEGSLISTAKLIISSAEKEYTNKQVLEESTNIECSDIVKMNDIDYDSCTVSFDSDGNATVSIIGSGKFEGLSVCSATKEDVSVIEDNTCPNPTAIATYITNLYNNETTRESNGLIQDDTDDTNIRYSGPDEVSHLITDSTNYVKNYVYFNCSDYNNQTSTTCEKWRIIGIFNVSNGVTTEERVKIVRNASIGGYSWDSSASDTNSGYGYNVWETIDGQVKGDSTTKADLNTLLNDYYYNAKSGQTCYYGQKNASTTCDFSSVGLNATSRSMIEDAVWNIGGFSSNEISAKTAYNAERGTTVYSPTIAKTEWKGIVGLIYPSDYGYATTDTGCRNSLDNYENSIYTCKNNNWLSNSFYYTLSPISSNSYNVFNVYSSGYACYGDAYHGYGVRPSIYLKSNINIIDGDGSSDYPYQLNA